MAFRPSKRRHHHIPTGDMNLTPIMNVFVIIIPFLLLTAVFAKTAVIDIFLPQEKAAAADQTSAPAEVLTVVVTEGGFQLGGIGRGVVIAKRQGRYDFEGLSAELAKVKGAYPKHEEVIILLKPDIEYEVVIQVMDSTRETTRTEGGEKRTRTLFPFVSLGEAR